MKSSPQEDAAFLLHIRDSCRLILSYSSMDEAEFLRDRKTQDAVVRNLETVSYTHLTLPTKRIV